MQRRAPLGEACPHLVVLLAPGRGCLYHNAACSIGAARAGRGKLARQSHYWLQGSHRSPRSSNPCVCVSFPMPIIGAKPRSTWQGNRECSQIIIWVAMGHLVEVTHHSTLMPGTMSSEDNISGTGCALPPFLAHISCPSVSCSIQHCHSIRYSRVIFAFLVQYDARNIL